MMSSGLTPQSVYAMVSGLGSTFNDGYGRARKRQTLAELSERAQSGNFAGAAEAAFGAGELGTGVSFLKLQQDARLRELGEQAGREFSSAIGGASPAGSPAPMLPAAARSQTPSGVHLAETEADVQRLERATGMTVDADLDRVVRTVYGEAANEPSTGQQAVAGVVMNRARSSGMTPTDVVLARGQFEPWSNPAARARMEALSPSSSVYQAIASNISPVMRGEAPDPSGGATHFYAPRAQAALGRAAPSWDDGSGTDIGNHRFFRHGYGPAGQGESAGAPVASVSRGAAPAGVFAAMTSGSGGPVSTETPVTTMPANAAPQGGVSFTTSPRSSTPIRVPQSRSGFDETATSGGVSAMTSAGLRVPDAPAVGETEAQGFVVPAGADQGGVDPRIVQALTTRIGAANEGTPGARISALNKVLANPNLPDNLRQVGLVHLKDAIDSTKAPDGVKEFMWARAQGMTQAKSPAAYEREKKGPTLLSPGQSVYDESTNSARFTAPDRDKGNETEKGLRAEFGKETKTFGEVQDAYGRVIAATKQREANPGGVSPASDIGLVFGFMKMLDPGSVVREGEYATAKNAGGVPDIVRNAYNKAVQGEFLQPAQRQDFADTAGRLYDQARGQAEGIAERYRGLAGQYGADPSRSVYLPPRLEAPTIGERRQQGQGPAKAVAAPSPAVEHLRRNPSLKADFDAKYGPGAADRALGAR